ncbi:hypothetical protein O7606_03080 [Micromonospora sp. WMMD882]|uniref:hypothetical protein n=1 Tax=Micromonospora sp. WMMD882 TaxID=3015151 RepID=UPI00248C8788|nr:hypothetical protein [Micromonospora sp. WMMD882]WBB80379.1 hypothetical protein O7606_03080 [Micromonospora sp. WMMD882]
MRVRTTLQVSRRGPDGERALTERLLGESERLFEALVALEDEGKISGVATETDAEEPSITAEAIVPIDDEDEATDHFEQLVLDLFRRDGPPSWLAGLSVRSSAERLYPS